MRRRLAMMFHRIGWRINPKPDMVLSTVSRVDCPELADMVDVRIVGRPPQSFTPGSGTTPRY